MWITLIYNPTYTTQYFSSISQAEPESEPETNNNKDQQLKKQPNQIFFPVV